jgi:NOL1/NOP2/fmu family ribosome biogenesis protein
MSTAAAVDIPSDAWVCDLCAAPGGKTTQLAARLGEGGFILANEYVPKRAKILVGNIERMGIRNAAVTSMDTSELAKLYSSVFDLVVADAPCSGEGMFRKDVPAIEEWSEENVRLCAERQATILDNAAKLVKGGGKLLYSTCTYSLEENEMTVDSFLSRHPEFSLIPVADAVASVTSDGVRFPGCTQDGIEMCRRFYPHKSRGEGQFIALMQKNTKDSPSYNFKGNPVPPTGDEERAVSEFFGNLYKRPDAKLIKHGNNLVLITHECPLPRHSVFSAGVLVGEVRGKLLFPSHQLFCAYGELFKRQIEPSEADLERYLAGEETEAPEGRTGYVAINYRGATIGGGKASNGRIKNYFPKGLRVR